MALLYVSLAILMPYKRINLTFSFFFSHCVPFQKAASQSLRVKKPKRISRMKEFTHENHRNYLHLNLISFFDLLVVGTLCDILLYEKYLVHIFILSTVCERVSVFHKNLCTSCIQKSYQQVGAEWVVQSVKCPQEKKLSSTLLILLLFCGMK